MTDPKVLADALVEAGILHHFGPTYFLKDGWVNLGTIDESLTDWRVAGKVLESGTPSPNLVIGGGTNKWVVCMNDGNPIGSDTSLPRAIIEAWYQAQESNNG